jgi:phosphatidylglycerol:prolipoprotein diacylglycerol transferase
MLAYWVHDLSPFAIRFAGNFGIRWYGLAYLTGFVGAAWLLQRYHRAGRSPLDFSAVIDLMTALVAGVIVGGRVGYFLLYQPTAFFSDPLMLFRVWEGGMASHGGMAGVAVALWWFTRKRPESMLHVADLVITTVPVGLFFGRLANFINGELWGKIAVVPWAVVFSHTGGGDNPRHPSQLYEAALEGLVLFLYLQWRFWKTDVARPQRQPAGQLTGEFLLAYALARAVCEVYREPDASLILGLSRGTFYSVFLVAAGVGLIAHARWRSQHKA